MKRSKNDKKLKDSQNLGKSACSLLNTYVLTFNNDFFDYLSAFF